MKLGDAVSGIIEGFPIVRLLGTFRFPGNFMSTYTHFPYPEKDQLFISTRSQICFNVSFFFLSLLMMTTHTCKKLTNHIISSSYHRKTPSIHILLVFFTSHHEANLTGQPDEYTAHEPRIFSGDAQYFVH